MSVTVWLQALHMYVFLTLKLPDHVSGADTSEASTKILDKLANLTGEAVTGMASPGVDLGADEDDVIPGHPCPFLEAELRRVQEEDRQRKDLGSLKKLPGLVCPSCSLWLKVRY